MAEWAGFENQLRRKSHRGSNPRLSATSRSRLACRDADQPRPARWRPPARRARHSPAAGLDSRAGLPGQRHAEPLLRRRAPPGRARDGLGEGAAHDVRPRSTRRGLRRMRGRRAARRSGDRNRSCAPEAADSRTCSAGGHSRCASSPCQGHTSSVIVITRDVPEVGVLSATPDRCSCRACERSATPRTDSPPGTSGRAAVRSRRVSRSRPRRDASSWSSDHPGAARSCGHDLAGPWREGAAGSAIPRC